VSSTLEDIADAFGAIKTWDDSSTVKQRAKDRGWERASTWDDRTTTSRRDRDRDRDDKRDRDDDRKDRKGSGGKDDDGKNKKGQERNPHRHQGYETPKETGKGMFEEVADEVLNEGWM
jgi:hypothetical protein